MIVEIISIGFELLNGRTVNTNASFISKKLQERGHITKWITTIPDEESYIKDAVLLALNRADLVITTGGLGPTNDDITKSVITRLLGGKEIFSDEVFSWVKKRFDMLRVPMPEINCFQAMVPNNAEVLYNEFGTAPGLLFKQNEKMLFVLPGVPKEMKFLMENEVLTRIQTDEKEDQVQTCSFKTIGMGESAIYEKLQSIIEKYTDVYFMFYPEFFGVEVKISGSRQTEVEKVKQLIIEQISDFIYSQDPNGSLQKSLGELLTEKRTTLSVAESCTGGLIGHLMTSVSGASQYFMGGIISYSNEAKMNLLNVKEVTLIKYGAVSEQTAKEMALGAKEKFTSDFGISVTGIAGPTGGTDEKPVGLVYIGLAYKGEVFAKKYLFGKDREVNKIRSAAAAMEMARKFLLTTDS